MSTQARADAVSPHELARKGGQFTGEIPFVAFQRLESLVGGHGAVDIVLHFEQDDHGRSRVHGRAVTAVTMGCQRCLAPVQRHIVADIDLRVVATEAEASEIANAYEAFVWAGEELSVVELIEDDLILALPNQVCDAYDACPNRPDLQYPGEPDADDRRANPFAALAEWQNRRN
jgi:uncharacterized protein